MDLNNNDPVKFLRVLRTLIQSVFSVSIRQINHKDLKDRLKQIQIQFSSFLQNHKKQNTQTIEKDKAKNNQEDQNDKANTDPVEYKMINQIAKLFVNYFPQIDLDDRNYQQNDQKISLSELSCLFEIKKIIDTKIFKLPHQEHNNDSLKADFILNYRDLKVNIKNAKNLLKTPSRLNLFQKLHLFTSQIQRQRNQVQSNKENILKIENNQKGIKKENLISQETIKYIKLANGIQQERIRVDIHYLRQKRKNYHFLKQRLKVISLKEKQLNEVLQ